MMNSPLSNRQPDRRFDATMLKPKSIKIFPAHPSEINENVPENKLERNVGKNPPQVKAISFAELIKPLAEAFKQEQQWVKDFGQEKIILSADLHDIVMMFGKLQQTPPKTSNDEMPPGDLP